MDVELIHDPGPAAALLDPIRLRILEGLEQPDSATGLARRLRMTRQRINYHLRELEKQGIVEVVEERRKRNCTERILRPVARSYVISPEVLGKLGADPAQVQDRFSAAYLVAVAARAIRDLAILQERAARANKKLATLTLQMEIRFASSDQRRRFTEELAGQIARLAAKYHDEKSPGGRRFQLVIGAYPSLKEARQQPAGQSSKH